MSKKKLINHIENLFADLRPEIISEGGAASIGVAGYDEAILNGWRWECDQHGVLTSIQGNQEKYLGYTDDEWNGQLLAYFALSIESSSRVRLALDLSRQEKRLFDIDVEYIHRDGMTLPARLTAFPILSEVEQQAVVVAGWHGIVLMQQPAVTDKVLARAVEEPGISIGVEQKSDAYLQPLEQKTFSGMTVEGEQIQPVMTPLTSIGWQSLQEQRTLTQAGSLYTQPAIAVPFSLYQQGLGLLEVVDDKLDRVWNEDELRLVEQVANQLSQVLENARLYQEQLEINRKLRELDKLKSRFLANMSHELRTPLNSIIGFSRVILKGIDGPVTDLQQQDLTAIHNAGQHLLQLINDVLDISKIEAGKIELSIDGSVNIVDLVNSAMSTAIGLIKDKPIKLEQLIQPDLPLVSVDPTRIRQVLINFLSNAAKFTGEGIIKIEAKKHTDPQGHPEIVVSVTDSGPGISPQDQAKLFQPFSQVDASPTRKVGGTGLGLSISRLLIELHGGRVGVKSEVGAGSTFYFTLPLPRIDS